jgi:cystathionine gamma-synthase
MNTEPTYSKSTAAVWAGEDNPLFKGAATAPIGNSVAFVYTDLNEWTEQALQEI